MRSRPIADKLNNLQTQLKSIEDDLNVEWFKYFPYDADLRVNNADKLEEMLMDMFDSHLESQEVVNRNDFFLLYLSWLVFVASDDLELFEKEYNFNVVVRCDEFATYAMKSEDTKRFNDFILYGDEEERKEKVSKNTNDTDYEQQEVMEEESINLQEDDLALLAMLVACARRSKDMARTETNIVCNQMLHEIAKSHYSLHTWVTERDARVRKTHRRADGQTKPINEPFQIGDYEMMFPCDTSLGAGAEEIVNCRCHEEFSN